jgi:uncharacterized membrane protein YheB (UPF0754 family)
MDMSSKLDQFRDDNPYDVQTQAKRLLATEDKDLILYTLALGLISAKSRQRHVERTYIKNIGAAPSIPKERLTPGRTTGSVKIVPIKTSRRMKNIIQQLIVDVWRVNGEQRLGDCTGNDLATAISRETSSANGHAKNAAFYHNLKEPMKPEDVVRQKWEEKAVRAEIEKVYGEFRKEEAA